jgi:hypothetical protein
MLHRYTALLSGATPLPAVASANLTESPEVMHTCA